MPSQSDQGLTSLEQKISVDPNPLYCLPSKLGPPSCFQQKMLMIKNGLACHCHLLISGDHQQYPYERNIHKHYEHHGSQHLQSELHLWASLPVP